MTRIPPSVPPATVTAAGSSWPDDRFHRLAAEAMLETLRGELLSHPSATLVLERWCRIHRLADGPVRAERQAVPDLPLPGDGAALLQIGADEPVRYRRVALRCGGRLLSEADNWYVPGRLTADMNRTLDNSDTPFGKVVAPLGFRRETLSSRLLWRPLPEDWATASPPALPPGGVLAIPPSLFETSARLMDRNNRPIALVRETYKQDVLAVAPPRP
ncbi:hypothetical protein [Rhizosaccharibacter radicis]|uniref:Chorismate lyase n=1 Tax=Rhizosaccharibacter radicis TaxID=2782605 RepID=A0ABT1VXR6_9PROT|nr:hypothetical protein [Acetobacteraceae bacterium KSS12]